MKIKPEKNYRKPLYAVGLAAVMMTASLTACTDTPADLEGEATCIETSETSGTEDIVELDGDVAVVDPG